MSSSVTTAIDRLSPSPGSSRWWFRDDRKRRTGQRTCRGRPRALRSFWSIQVLFIVVNAQKQPRDTSDLYASYLQHIFTQKEQNKTAAINQNNNQRATSSTTTNKPTERDPQCSHVTRSRDTFPVKKVPGQTSIFNSISIMWQLESWTETI